MKLRLKVLIILASMWVLISISIFLYSRYTLTTDYARLEQKEMINDIARTQKTLNTMISSLTLLTTDWAEWDDAYQFMQNKNKTFIKSNMAFTTFENAKINLILFFNPSGKLFYGQNYDLQAKKFVPVPSNLLSFLESDKSLTTHTSLHSKKVGIFKAREGYIVLSSLPIVTSEGKGPIRGTLIMGYFFDDQQIQNLSEILHMQVRFFPLPLTNPDPLLRVAQEILTAGATYYIAAQNQETLYGFSLITDIERKPIGILRITSPRTLYNQGLITLDRYLAIVISIGIIFLIAIWYLLKIYVLDRIISVSQQVTEINSESKFSKRITTSGHDELTNMVAVINSLLEIIELTQEQLKYRIFLRTEELERLSKLNKNLYSEMNKQKETEIQLREGEKVLRHMAYYDALTGLPNRVFFNEILEKILRKAARDSSGLAILFLDANKFKNINDTYGHDIGDKFLQHTAQQLKMSIRDTDALARLAGDEFIICLSDIQGKIFITKIVKEILNNLSTPLIINDAKITSTYSIGICIYPEDGQTIEELEKHADLAMYYAKKQPDNAFYYYDEITKQTSIL